MLHKHTWFAEQAFGEQAERQTAIDFQSHMAALKFLREQMAQPDGIALLQGPKGSGKHSIIDRYLGVVSKDTERAVIDGTRMKPHDLLSTAMTEFGYVTDLTSVDELLKMFNVFAVQQVRTCQAPVLIIENADRMYPGTLRVLALLAAFVARGQFAVRMILTGERDFSSLLSSESMVDVAKRAGKPHNIQPITAVESMKYLYSRLEACGVRQPDSVFPVDVCDRLFEQSDGWPGKLNSGAIAALEHASSFPLHVESSATETPAAKPGRAEAPAKKPVPPSLVITRNGKDPVHYTFNSNKVLIGRSKLADIVINDTFASKTHALMMLYSDSLVLLDLNSTNGTLVNSVRSKTTILRSDDVISLGQYRIKVQNAPVPVDGDQHASGMADTTKMKNIQDMQRQKIRRASWASRERQKKA